MGCGGGCGGCVYRAVALDGFLEEIAFILSLDSTNRFIYLIGEGGLGGLPLHR